jgi:hypothetical protein
MTNAVLFLPFRWVSSAEGTKKSSKLKKTGKRMKRVGTGSRKTSDLPLQLCYPVTSPLSLIFVSSIFGREESSPDFSEAPLMLFSSSFSQAQVPILGSHFARSHDWCHHYFL